MADVRVLSTMGLAGVIKTLGPEFEQAHGAHLDILFEPTLRLMERFRSGERGDVAILTEEGVDELVASGVLERRADLARSFVGVAVRAGAAHPDISTPDAFVASLLNAKSIAMSKAGASGMFMAGLLERLGIADAVRDKAIIMGAGFTAELAAEGKAEIAIQQVSELQVVPGVEIVGRLPKEIEGVTLFSAGVFRDAPNRVLAEAFIAELAAPARAGLYRQCGLEPAGTGAALPA
jgi:molybdate transport system substrate-binding protein